MLLYCTQGHENPSESSFCGECGQQLPLAVGQVLEHRYRIVRQLGQGGFGCTFLAQDINRSNQHCVLKAFAPQDQRPEQLKKAKELFEREARVLYQLQHAQIPAFQSMFQTVLGSQEYLFLVQDYVEGDTYENLLARKSFSEVEIHQLLSQILPVLSYIHSIGVIHRDISPDNLILRSSDSLPVLIDFGGVKQLIANPVFWRPQIGVVHTRLGKQGYAPKEQLEEGKVFPNSDLYALAVTSLVLITGKQPQKLCDSYKGTWHWGREISVSPSLEAVLKKMLAYKSSDRYQTADEVLQALPSPITPPLSSLTQLKTINLTGNPPPQSSHQEQTQAIVPPAPLHKNSPASSPRFNWLRPLTFKIVGAVLAIAIGMNAWALVNAVIGAKLLPAKQSSSASEKKLIDEIFRRRQALAIQPNIFNILVDAQFYAKHPDLQGRSLKSNSEDASLRQEWDESAQELLDRLEKAELSGAARLKLGNYSQQDYEIWKQKASLGQLNGHTIDQLEKQTDEKFTQLFPQQQSEKMNLHTFGQVWYAIFADRADN